VTVARLPRTAALLGCGAVGNVLLPALRTHKVRIVAAWNRTPRTPQWRSGALPRAIREAELVLLSVSDAAIAPLCAQLVAQRLIGPGQTVAHLAGALDLTPLQPALACGARVGSIHPLRAVPPGSRADAFAGATAGIDGSDDEARGQLIALAQTLSMEALLVSGSRALYHAAAVLAGGSQVALFAEAVRAFQSATGATEAEARAALLPLARGALDTLSARTPAQAVTGPVARGDAATLATHLRALEAHDAHTATIYSELAKVSLSLTRSVSRSTPEQLTAIDQVLDTASGSSVSTKPATIRTRAKPAAVKAGTSAKKSAPRKR
jgi:predicted short-subunit dehydrogenase-like oxidoreductase (DUF2520 family)